MDDTKLNYIHKFNLNFCLFISLAQNESSAGTGNENKMEEAKTMAGLFDGSGEYTLVYEDNEGDRMLVGDVPWQ